MLLTRVTVFEQTKQQELTVLSSSLRGVVCPIARTKKPGASTSPASPDT